MEAALPSLLENAPPELAEARACLERGDLGEALLLLRLAEGSPGPVTEVRRLLGLAHLASGDVGAAIEDLAAAARARPQDPAIRAALDAALEQLADRAPEPAAEPIAVRSPEGATAPAGSDVFAADEEDLLRELARAASSVAPAAGGVLDRVATAVGRRALPWAVAFFLVGAGGFTAIATFRLRAGSSGADRDAVATPAAGGDSNVDQRVPGARSARAAGRAGRAERAASVVAGGVELQPFVDRSQASGPETAGPQVRATAGPADASTRTASQAVGSAPEVTSGPRGSAAAAAGDRDAPAAAADPQGDPDRLNEASDVGAPAAPVPAYAFMDRLGLAPPPGGVLDPENSELLRFLREGPPRDGAGPLVLTFRTAEAPEVVAEFYAREAGVRLRLREVAMGGPFQGVVRTVGRGTARLADGSRATLTVSRPGVDPASRSLVPETTVRFDVR